MAPIQQNVARVVGEATAQYTDPANPNTATQMLSNVSSWYTKKKSEWSRPVENVEKPESTDEESDKQASSVRSPADANANVPAANAEKLTEWTDIKY